MPKHLYPKNQENRLLGLAKAPRIDDHKRIRIALIRIRLRSLRSSILGSFRSCQKTDFPGSLGIYILAYIFSVASVAFAKNPAATKFPNAPWLTGPLLAPSAHVTPFGSVNMQPYYYCYYSNKAYDSGWKKISAPSTWTNTFQLYAYLGLTSWMDFFATPSVSYARSDGRGALRVGDLPLGVDVQVLWDAPDNYLPALKLGFRETFPLGNFDHLDPDKKGTDAGGLGSYQSKCVLCASRPFHLSQNHWLNVRLVADYTVSSRVHVRGYNAYGGGKDTDAYVYLPQCFDVDLAYELTFTKNWVFACDNVVLYSAARKYKGYPGRLKTGELADLAHPSAISFSMAPAIEYNWSEYIGLITGVWFSLAGRNSPAFVNWITAVNIIF